MSPEITPTPPPERGHDESSAAPKPGGELFTQASGESDRAFEAFRVYLELGPKRRYLAAARKVISPHH